MRRILVLLAAVAAAFSGTAFAAGARYGASERVEELESLKRELSAYTRDGVSDGAARISRDSLRTRIPLLAEALSSAVFVAESGASGGDSLVLSEFASGSGADVVLSVCGQNVWSRRENFPDSARGRVAGARLSFSVSNDGRSARYTVVPRELTYFDGSRAGLFRRELSSAKAEFRPEGAVALSWMDFRGEGGDGVIEGSDGHPAAGASSGTTSGNSPGATSSSSGTASSSGGNSASSGASSAGGSPYVGPADDGGIGPAFDPDGEAGASRAASLSDRFLGTLGVSVDVFGKDGKFWCPGLSAQLGCLLPMGLAISLSAGLGYENGADFVHDVGEILGGDDDKDYKYKGAVNASLTARAGLSVPLLRVFNVEAFGEAGMVNAVGVYGFGGSLTVGMDGEGLGVSASWLLNSDGDRISRVSLSARMDF